MIYLNDIVSYVPATKRSIAELAAVHRTDSLAEYQLSQHEVNVFQNVFGLRQIAFANDENLHDILDKALERIVPSNPSDKRNIKYIFHCHAAPCVCPSGTTLIAELKKKHGLEHAIAVGLAQDQCATPLTALRLADVLLHGEDDDAKILILTGEVGFHPMLQVIPNTTVMGDASAACLVGKTGQRNAVLTVAQRKFEHASVQPSTPGIAVPATSYGDDLIQVIKDALNQASMTMNEISLILVHNVNTISWKFFARNFPCSANLIYLNNVPKNGHCFTSDPFINYCDALQEGRLKAGDHFMMVSVGTTSTFAAVVLKH